MTETTRKQLEEQILEVLKGLDDSDIVNVWNEYCERNNYYDDRLESMDLLDEIYAGQEPTEILRRAFYGHDQFGDESEFNPNRDWFYFNGYGNLVSVECVGWNDYANEFMFDRFDEDAVIDYILDNMDALECDEITEILDDYENGID